MDQPSDKPSRQVSPTSTTSPTEKQARSSDMSSTRLNSLPTYHSEAVKSSHRAPESATTIGFSANRPMTRDWMEEIENHHAEPPKAGSTPRMSSLYKPFLNAKNRTVIGHRQPVALSHLTSKPATDVKHSEEESMPFAKASEGIWTESTEKRQAELRKAGWTPRMSP